MPHEWLATDELASADYRRNGPDRCFHCKDELYRRLRQLADARGFAAVLDGTNADDTGDFRPGRRAAESYGVRSPLLEAGIGKEGGPRAGSRTRPAGGRRTGLRLSRLPRSRDHSDRRRSPEPGGGRRRSAPGVRLFGLPGPPPRGPRPHRAAGGPDHPRARTRCRRSARGTAGRPRIPAGGGGSPRLPARRTRRSLRPPIAIWPSCPRAHVSDRLLEIRILADPDEDDGAGRNVEVRLIARARAGRGSARGLPVLRRGRPGTHRGVRRGNARTPCLRASGAPAGVLPAVRPRARPGGGG